jgi:multiple sugar transport system ATP-binding protein
MCLAMMHGKRFLFADDPFIGLGLYHRMYLLEVLRIWQKISRSTVIFATRNLSDSLCVADDVIVIRDGFLHQWGSQREIYDTPQSIYIAGSATTYPMNLIRGRRGLMGFEAERGDFKLNAELPWPEETPLIMGVRGEDIVLEGEGTPPTHSGTVILEELIGLYKLLHVEIGDEEFLLRTPADQKTKVGRIIRFHFKSERLHWFEPSTGKRML